MKNHLKNDWENPIERKGIKKYEEQFPITQMLNNEVEIIQFLKGQKKVNPR
jgi:hypothetical protein